MKKYFLLLILAHSALISVISQEYHPFVTTGKTWSDYHNYCKVKDYPFSVYNKFEGDILIGSMVYKIVWQTEDSVTSPWTISCYVREDAMKKVYQMSPAASHDEIIYDFAALPGDTISLRGTGEINLYVVDSLSWTTLLNNESRRVFYLHSIYFALPECWIEGVGCTKGSLAGGTCGYVGDQDPRMICFFENDTLKYHNTDFDLCYLTTGVSYISKEPAVSVFPNPASETLTFEFSGNAPANALIELSDLAGITLRTFTVNGHSCTLNLKDAGIPPGMYFYRITGSASGAATGKIIIQ